jgi:hypothetical protein
MTLLSLAYCFSALQEEGEPVARNPWLAGLLIMLGAAVFVGIVAWRMWDVKRRWQRRMRTIAISVPFVDQEALCTQLRSILRPYGLRQKEITGNPILFEPGSIRKLSGAVPVSLAVSGNRTATIIGPAALVRIVKLQFPGSEERDYPSEVPSLKPVLKFSALLFLGAFVVVAGIVMVAVFQSR